jgi:predicted metal-dependent hydrolase
LKVAPRTEPAAVKLSGRRLHVAVDRKGSAEERAAEARQALESWYRQHASERLTERVAVWARRLGVAEPRVVIRDQQRRWGSCDGRGVLRFNWRIVQAPMRLVDYVVLHELVHLAHREHTRAFWAQLGRVMPDLDRRREELRRIGARLEW